MSKKRNPNKKRKKVRKSKSKMKNITHKKNNDIVFYFSDGENTYMGNFEAFIENAKKLTKS